MPKRNKKLAEFIKTLPCEVCESQYQVSGHHIISFKSRPDLDIEPNIIPLCFKHHREIHDLGTRKFVLKYYLTKNMEDRGFYFDDVIKKWRYNGKVN